MRRRASCGNANMVGQRIRAIRRKQGLSQGELLARIQLRDNDMTQSKLSRIEGQLIIVMDKDLCVIADALGVSILDLLVVQNRSE